MTLNHWFLIFLLFLSERKHVADNDYPHFPSVSESYWTAVSLLELNQAPVATRCGYSAYRSGLMGLLIYFKEVFQLYQLLLTITNFF